MDIAQAGLKTQPFRTHGVPTSIVHYQSEQSAHNYLRMIAAGDRGIGVVYGPEDSGKRTIIFQFVASLPSDLAVAVVDGTRLNAMGLLDAMRPQFAYDVESELAETSLNELQEFILQRARERRTPLLIIEEFNKMYPSALRILCRLAELKIQGRFALRLILVNIGPAFNIIHSPAMTAIASRTMSSFEVGPMTRAEAATYLHEKLRSSGCDDPESAIPSQICGELHRASGGWPGVLEKFIMHAIERAQDWPIQLEHIFPPEVQSPQATEATEGNADTEVAEVSDTAANVNEVEDTEAAEVLTLTEVVGADEATEGVAVAKAVDAVAAAVAEAVDALTAAEAVVTADAVQTIEEDKPEEDKSEEDESADDVELTAAADAAPTSPPAIAAVRDSVEPDAQKLYLTLNRETLQEFDLEESKTLIGRSEVCDIVVDSRFVSKYHALLIRKDDAMFLIDLNSKNGTFINSERVGNAVLRHEDVISLGNHGIKLVAPAYKTRPQPATADPGETAVMRTLADLRAPQQDADEEIIPVKQDEI